MEKGRKRERKRGRERERKIERERESDEVVNEKWEEPTVPILGFPIEWM